MSRSASLARVLSVDICLSNCLILPSFSLVLTRPSGDMMISVLTLSLTLVCASVVGAGTLLQVKEECHSTVSNAGEFLATKTPYSPEGDALAPAGCTERQIWILNRHGTRNPGDDDILDMINILPGLRNSIVNSRGKLCQEELIRLLQWSTNVTVEEENFLVRQGYQELTDISRRYQQNFPQLFPRTFSNDSYGFRSTVEQRTIESAKAFAQAIFGEEALPEVYFPEPVEGDPIMHFYKTCERWIKEVDENPEAMVEAEKFLSSPVFENSLNRIRERLNLKNITSAQVLLMYKTCAFETAWNPPKISPWCVVFDEEDLRVMEYQEDLEDWWMDGYAYPINYEQACQPVVDVLDKFTARANNTDEKLLTTAYFAHSGTILKVFGRLGLFRDPEALTSDRYSQYKHEREWRNSKIGKFASNLAFVLFECPDQVDRFQVATFVQEKPTPLPACGGQWICPLKTFADNLNSVIESCDLERICKVST